MATRGLHWDVLVAGSKILWNEVVPAHATFLGHTYFVYFSKITPPKRKYELLHTTIGCASSRAFRPYIQIRRSLFDLTANWFLCVHAGRPIQLYDEGKIQTHNTTIRGVWQLEKKNNEEFKHMNRALVDRLLLLIPEQYKRAFILQQLTSNPKMIFLQVFEWFCDQYIWRRNRGGNNWKYRETSSTAGHLVKE